MNQELLAYFQRELEFLATDAIEFGQEYPETAGLVEPGQEPAKDPHVERFINAFALLNADLQMKLDGAIPDVADALLNNMFPYCQRPLPSMTVVQMQAATQHAAGPSQIAAGTELTAAEHHGVTCRFRTCYSVTPLPVRIASVKMAKPRATMPVVETIREPVSVLQIGLESTDPRIPTIQHDASTLRLFLRGGRQTTFPLYELLTSHTQAMVLRAHGTDRTLIRRNSPLVRPVGFHRSEGVIPWSSRSADAARILTEFFHFPEKFLFVDLPGWDGEFSSAEMSPSTDTATSIADQNKADLFIYLDKTFPSLETQLTVDNLQLNCTPAVNIYQRRCEPVRLTHDLSEYPVATGTSGEVFSIDEVVAVSNTETRDIREFFAPAPGGDTLSSIAGPFWRARRTAGAAGGTGLLISVADPEAQLMDSDAWVLDIKATCLDANVPETLPFQGSGPALKIEENDSVSVVCLVPPSSRRCPRLSDDARWCLSSLLALQSLPLVDEHVRHRRLREALILHNRTQSPELLGMIDGITDARIESAFEEIFVHNSRVFCQGAEISLQIDSDRYPGRSSYLFCSVIAEFLARSCSLNSFCRLKVESQAAGSVIHSFPAATGEQVLEAVC